MANENLDQLKIELEKQLNQLFNSQDNFNQGSKEIVKKKKISNFSKSQFNDKTKEKSTDKKTKYYFRNFLYLIHLIFIFLFFLWVFRHEETSGDWLILFLLYNFNLCLWRLIQIYKKKKRRKKLSNNIQLILKNDQV